MPCGTLAAPAARWPYNGPPAEPLVAAMPPLRGGTTNALAEMIFNGVIGRLRRSHPLLEGGGPKGRGILIAEGGSFGASSPKELARRERTTLLAGSTPYDIWELPFQGLPPAARPDLRISPLRVIGRLRSEADAMKAPVGLSSPRSRPKGGMGCTTPNPYFKSRDI